jgi:hypothetical protein
MMLDKDILVYEKFLKENASNINPQLLEESFHHLRTKLTIAFKEMIEKKFLNQEDISLPNQQSIEKWSLEDLSRYTSEILVLNDRCKEIFDKKIPLDSLEKNPTIYDKKKLNLTSLSHVQKLSDELVKIINGPIKTKVTHHNIGQQLKTQSFIQILRSTIQKTFSSMKEQAFSFSKKELSQPTKEDLQSIYQKMTTQSKNGQYYYSEMVVENAAKALVINHSQKYIVSESLKTFLIPIALAIPFLFIVYFRFQQSVFQPTEDSSLFVSVVLPLLLSSLSTAFYFFIAKRRPSLRFSPKGYSFLSIVYALCFWLMHSMIVLPNPWFASLWFGFSAWMVGMLSAKFSRKKNYSLHLVNQFFIMIILLNVWIPFNIFNQFLLMVGLFITQYFLSKFLASKE